MFFRNLGIFVSVKFNVIFFLFKLLYVMDGFFGNFEYIGIDFKNIVLEKIKIEDSICKKS